MLLKMEFAQLCLLVPVAHSSLCRESVQYRIVVHKLYLLYYYMAESMLNQE